MKELKSVGPAPKDYEKLQAEIIKAMKLFYSQFLIKTIKVTNAGNELEYALSVGRVWYAKTGFGGTFNSRTSKILRDLGATWNKKKNTWDIPIEALPVNILNAIAQADSSNAVKIDNLIKSISSSDPIKAAEQFVDSKAIKDNIGLIDLKIDETVKKIPTVKIQLNEQQKEELRKKYSENMQLNIRNWGDKKIVRLREYVKKMTDDGLRYEEIVDKIAKDFSTSVKHAKFLAKQETHLLLAEIKVQKYTGAGINKYKWKTRNLPVGNDKGDVRPSHAALDGKIFDWSHPPIVDGRPVHPGQDFNCRCVAIPLWQES